MSTSEINYLKGLGVTLTFSEYRKAYQLEINRTETSYYPTDFHYEVDESLECCVVFLLRHDSYTSHFAFSTWMYAFYNTDIQNIHDLRFYVDKRDIFDGTMEIPEPTLAINFRHNTDTSSLICFKDFRYVTIIL
jgi:hypothetical protein